MRPILLASLVLLLISACAAKAQVLLTIDDSNPGAVTITATTLSANANASTSINDGIDLLNFLVGNLSIPSTGSPVTSSNLTSGNLTGSGPYYDSWAPDDIDTPGGPDLTLYSSGTGTETFTTMTTAFTGTLTLDLTGEPLPVAGTSGTIVTGYSGDSPNNTSIGQWKVESVSAPEPSSWMLLFGSFAVVVLWRSRRSVLRPCAEPAN